MNEPFLPHDDCHYVLHLTDDVIYTSNFPMFPNLVSISSVIVTSSTCILHSLKVMLKMNEAIRSHHNFRGFTIDHIEHPPGPGQFKIYCLFCARAAV